MPRKGQRKPRAIVGNPSDPEGMWAALKSFESHLRVKNFSKRTIEVRDQHLLCFIGWCDERSIGRPGEITKVILEQYQRHLHYYRKSSGHPITPKTQCGHLTSIRVFFKWLARENRIPFNPASEIELPKVGFHLPHGVLSVSEVETILNSVDVNKPLGIRDRSILEVLYSTGLRRKEIAELEIEDVKMERGVVFVEQGKGKKDRVVPIGGRAIAWVEKYLYEVRPELLPSVKENALFLNDHGDCFTPANMGSLVKKRIVDSEIQVDGSCHIFRHSMATQMLENGADIRYIQQILGHAKLETTQIYTRVSIEMLKKVHAATHPARLHRTPPPTRSGLPLAGCLESNQS